MAPVQLEFPVADFELGACFNGAQPLAGEQTLQILNLHLQYNHDHGGVVQVQGHQAGGGRLLKI